MSVQVNDLNPHWDRPVLSVDRPSNVLDFRGISISPEPDLTHEGALRLIEEIYAPKPVYQRINRRQWNLKRHDRLEALLVLGPAVALGIIWAGLHFQWVLWR